MKLVVVPCTKEKIWDKSPMKGAVAACDAYRGRGFAAWQKWAEASGAKWVVLSTKYGLVEPHQQIEPYERRVADAGNDPEFMKMVRQQAIALGVDSESDIELLDWEAFEGLLRRALKGLNARVTLRKLMY